MAEVIDGMRAMTARLRVLIHTAQSPSCDRRAAGQQTTLGGTLDLLLSLLSLQPIINDSNPCGRDGDGSPVVLSRPEEVRTFSP